MATHQIEGPDGHTYSIDAPDGASEEEIINYAKQNFHTAEGAPTAQPPTSVLQNAVADIKDLATPWPVRMIRGAEAEAAKPGGPTVIGDTLKGAVEPFIHPLDYTKAHPVKQALNAALMGMGPSVEDTTIGTAIPAADRAAGVSLADQIGMPLTRADVTGGRLAGGAESSLEKTLAGSQAISDVRTAQGGAMDALKAGFQKMFGTEANPRDTGMGVKQAIEDNIHDSKAVASHFYNQIPDMPVPTPNLEKEAGNIIQEHQQLPKANQDQGLLSMASEYANRSSKATKTTGGGDFVGVTNKDAGTLTDLPEIADKATTGEPHAVYSYDWKLAPDSPGQPYVKLFGDKTKLSEMGHSWGSDLSLEQAQKEGIPLAGKTPGAETPSKDVLDIANKQSVKNKYGIGYNASPEEISQVPGFNLSTLRSIQSDLGSKMEMAKRAGQSVMSPTGRGYARLSNAIDSDIEALSTSDSPITKMMGEDATQNLTKGNAVWSAMKDIDKHPLIKSIRNSAPEDVPNKIFKSGNFSDVNTARAAMGDQAFNAAKQHYFNDLIQDPKLEKKLGDMDPEFAKAAFSRPEMEALNKVVMLKKLTGTAEKMGGATGSARTNSAMITAGGVGAGLATAATSLAHGNLPGVVIGLGGAGLAAYGPKLAADAYLRFGRSGVNLPTSALTYPLSTVAPAAFSSLQSLRDRMANQQDTTNVQ